jgi:hypothetical protein
MADEKAAIASSYFLAEKAALPCALNAAAYKTKDINSE